MSGGNTSRRRHTIWVAIACLGISSLGMAACSQAGNDTERTTTACAVLGKPQATPWFEPDDVTPDLPLHPTVGDVLAWMLRSVDQQQVTVLIYLDPGANARDLAVLADATQAQDGVVSVREIGRDETFRAFQRLFEGQTKMLEDVRPENLPTSVHTEVESDAAQHLVSWAEERSGIFAVRALPDPVSLIDGALSKASDREAWETLSAALATVEGDPEWATTSAAVIDSFLSEGQVTPYDDADALTAARLEIDQLVAECPPD